MSLATLTYTVAHDVFFATVRAMASKDPSERHNFCSYPRRDEATMEILPRVADPVAYDLEQSIFDVGEEFTPTCVGIANGG